MRHLLFGILLVAVIAASGCDLAAMSATFSVRSAPPPPTFSFRDEPRFRYLSDFRVSVIADDEFGCDMFSCDGYYYVYNAGYWYRASSTRGAFVGIEARRVPSRVFAVDDQHYRWRNHPQGWRGRGHDKDRGRDHNGSDDHDRGHGGDQDPWPGPQANPGASIPTREGLVTLALV